MSEEIDHQYTPEIVCPHCGRKHYGGDYPADSGEMECECGGRFEWSRIIIHEYVTEPITP